MKMKMRRGDLETDPLSSSIRLGFLGEQALQEIIPRDADEVILERYLV